MSHWWIILQCIELIITLAISRMLHSFTPIVISCIISFTLDIFVFASPVRKPKLLISFWTTKFCSSRLKFWVQEDKKQNKKRNQEKHPQDQWYHWYQTSLLWIGPLDWMVKLTWDLHQRMKISATILKSSVESAFGSLSHLDLERIITWNREVSCWDKLSCVRSYGTWQYYNLINEKYRCIKLREYREKNWTNFTNQNIPQRSWNKN